MKKVYFAFLIFFLSFSITSCKSDDNSSGQDLLIGTWKINQELVNDIEQDLGCDANSTFEFRSNFTFIVNGYDEDGSSGCILDETIEGTWLKLNDTQYSFTDTDNVTSTTELIFNGSDEFSITEVDGSFTYIIVYQRQ